MLARELTGLISTSSACLLSSQSSSFLQKQKGRCSISYLSASGPRENQLIDHSKGGVWGSVKFPPPLAFILSPRAIVMNARGDCGNDMVGYITSKLWFLLLGGTSCFFFY